MKKLNIGISMREVNSLEYTEKRDSIARDWYKFMQKVLPNSNWILIPNIEKDIIKYIKSWQINGFILTGGEDIGKSKERDFSEKQIFKYAQKNSLPILGVCRGLQLIYKFMGGDIEQNDKTFSNLHLAKPHEIILDDNRIINVNSFHSNKLKEELKPDKLRVLARCKLDNSIEAFEGDKILGIMWHPEREEIPKNWDSYKIRKLFKHE